MRGMTVAIAILCACALAPLAVVHGDDAARSAFFNGKDLEGWEGHTELWSVKDGVIIAKNKDPIKVSTYLVTKPFQESTVRTAISQALFFGSSRPLI